MDLVVPSLIGIGSAALTALLGWWSLRRLEIEKGKRARRATGVLFQAELIQLYETLSEHNRYLYNHASEVWSSLDRPGAVDYRSISIEVPIFDKEISNIGLFEINTSYNLVYCYFNISRFRRSQGQYAGLLVDLRKAPNRGRYADDLDREERELIAQIAQVIPKLAAESQAIPFNSGHATESLQTPTSEPATSAGG